MRSAFSQSRHSTRLSYAPRLAGIPGRNIWARAGDYKVGAGARATMPGPYSAAPRLGSPVGASGGAAVDSRAAAPLAALLAAPVGAPAGVSGL